MVKSVYIHIPFCKTICSYCDFCKFFYNKQFVSYYLEQLEKEIKDNYLGESIKTIYIGGGTPSCLDVNELAKLLDIISTFHKEKNIEFTVECNVETLTEEKIKLFVKNGVNRVSLGVQSLLDKNVSFLDRHHTKDDVTKVILLLKKYGICNINLDLIYALPKQTLEDLKKDIDNYLELGITHISTYSLMIEPNTKLFINKVDSIEEDLDLEMYKFICSYLKERGFDHYEISNFCKPGNESKHNLTYWNNEEYYGFGVGASGYLLDIRYDNTKSLTDYFKGMTKVEEISLDRNIKIENEFILGFRKVKGISKKEFKKKYSRDICDIIEIKNLLKYGKLLEDKEYVWIKEDYLYISNSILVSFIGGKYE